MSFGSKSLYRISFQGHALCEMHEEPFPNNTQGRKMIETSRVPVTVNWTCRASLESSWPWVSTRLNNRKVVIALQLLSKPKFSGVEKIKTIGSTYMAATGLSAVPSQEHAQVRTRWPRRAHASLGAARVARGDRKPCRVRDPNLSD